MNQVVAAIDSVEISERFIRRFDRSGPRYTSYPTADRFHDDFNPKHYITALTKRQFLATPPPYSLYAHLPFCEALCYFCACNKIITQDHSRSAAYIDILLKELQLLDGFLGPQRTVSQLHLGGGTPTFLQPNELKKLLTGFKQHFDFSSTAELAIEIDPRTTTKDLVYFLADLGFNRTSFGVQDFDPEVQQAVNRIQPYELVAQAMEHSVEAGFDSINADLIYGLPKQSVDSFERTIQALLKLKPNRIALYNYAHLPQRFKAQRLIQASDLPSADERLQIFLLAAQQLLDAGYEYIGLDHFALPDDDLNKARLNQSLHRNFQGYTTHAHSDLIGLGVSAIGNVQHTHVQNQRSLKAYTQAIQAGELASFRGHRMSTDDVLRSELIMDLMCSNAVHFADLEARHHIVFKNYFASELQALQPYVEAGLVQLNEEHMRVTAKGRLFVRAISMEFDAYLAQRTAATYSRLI